MNLSLGNDWDGDGLGDLTNDVMMTRVLRSLCLIST